MSTSAAESEIKRERKKGYIDISVADGSCARRRVVDLNRARIFDNEPLKWMSPATFSLSRDDEDLLPRGATHAALHYLSRHSVAELGIPLCPILRSTRISRGQSIPVLLCRRASSTQCRRENIL